MQHNHISVKYTSDLQTELQVVSVLNTHPMKPGDNEEDIHATTQLRRHSPCTWPYSRYADTSRYCKHSWRKLVFTVSITCEGMQHVIFPLDPVLPGCF